MKKVMLIVTIVILTLGIGLAGFFGYKFYQFKNDPVLKIFSHMEELSTSESIVQSHVQYSRDDFDGLFAKLPIKFIPNDIAGDILFDINKKFTSKSKRKIVLDPDRKDFGIYFNTEYYYDKDKLITFDIDSDFNFFKIASPELLSKSIPIYIPDLSENVDELDLRPYFNILKEDKISLDRKKIYFKIIREFLDKEHFRALEKDELDSFLAKAPENIDYTLNAYEIKLTYKEALLLSELICDALKNDQITKNHIFAKMDLLFEHFIDSGDYNLLSMEKEEVEEAYAEMRSKISDDIENSKFNLAEYLPKNLRFIPADKLNNMTFNYVFMLDEKDSIRAIKLINKSGEFSYDSYIVFNALSDEVEESEPIDFSEIYEDRLELSSLRPSLLKNYALEMGVNFSKNVLVSPAVEHLAADIVKEIKAKEDFRGKDKLVDKLLNIREVFDSLFSLYKMLGI